MANESKSESLTMNMKIEARRKRCSMCKLIKNLKKTDKLSKKHKSTGVMPVCRSHNCNSGPDSGPKYLNIRRLSSVYTVLQLSKLTKSITFRHKHKIRHAYDSAS